MKNYFFLILILLLVNSASAELNGYEVGDQATDFELKNVDGSTVSLADYDEAKGFIVVFTCNTCPYANKYEDRIIELHNKFAPQGFPVIAINPNDTDRQPGDSFEEMKERAEEKDYPFPYLKDESQQITKAYGASRTPHAYVLEKVKDKYMVKYIGAIDDNYQDPSDVNQKYIENAVNSILKGKPVENKHTKAIGCTIKWKS